MKVLIIAQSRSGSTTLLKAISKSLSHNIIYEPFNEHSFDHVDKDIETIKNSTDIVVKIVDNHFYKCKDFENEEHLFTLFDKVIGLTRNSTEENVISFLVAERFNSWRESSKDKNLPYSQDVLKNSKEYSFLYEKAQKITKEIKSFNIFQTTYEGLYVNKNEIKALEKYLGFEVENYITKEGPL